MLLLDHFLGLMVRGEDACCSPHKSAHSTHCAPLTHALAPEEVAVPGLPSGAGTRPLGLVLTPQRETITPVVGLCPRGREGTWTRRPEREPGPHELLTSPQALSLGVPIRRPS